MEENKLTYKEAMAEIEDIVTKLENNQLDVDELSGKVKRVIVKDIPYQTLHFGNGVLRGVRSGMGFHNISCIPNFIFTHHLRRGSYFVLHIVHPFKYKTISCIKRDRKRTAVGTAPRESHPGPC